MASSLPVDLQLESVTDWLVQRKLVSSSYGRSLRTLHARLASALAEPRPPLTLPATLCPGASREAVTYFDCLELLEALKAAGMGEKNFIGQYTDVHTSRWADIVRRYESGAIYLADTAAFLVQQVSYELPALKAEASRAEKELSELQRRQGEYNRLAAGARERFVAACEKKKLGCDCAREDIRRRLLESRTQLRATYAQVASLCHAEPMVDAARFYRDFVSHCLNVAAKFAGDQAAGAGGNNEGTIIEAPKGKAGKGKAAKARAGGGGALVPMVVANASEVSESSLCRLRQVQSLDIAPLLEEPTASVEGGNGASAIARGIDWGIEASDGADATSAPAKVDWDITIESEKGSSADGAQVDWGGASGNGIEVDWGISASGGDDGVGLDSKIDWGDGGGAGAGDWAGLIEVEGSDASEETVFDILESTERRNELLDDLHELDGFLATRLEQMAGDVDQGLPACLQLDAVEINARLNCVREVRSILESEHTRHLLLLGEPRYVERQEQALTQLLNSADKMASLAEGLQARQAELRLDLASSRPKYKAAAARVKSIKADFEAALSKHLDGRGVNLMGAINAI